MMRWRYWLDFIWLPVAIVATILIDCRSLSWLALFALGFLGWTFIEYWVHRSLLHRIMWHGTHERHHQQPAEYVEVIWWYTPPLFAALWLALPPSIFAGFAAGYFWFLTMHHWLHHIDLRERTWLHRYASWHSVHHRGGPKNYGITNSIWDRVFGTYQSEEEFARTVRARQALRAEAAEKR